MSLHPLRVRRFRDRRRERAPEPLRRNFRGVRLENPHLRLDDLGERPEADSIAVRKGPPPAPRDRLPLCLDDGTELAHEPALADPRHSNQGDKLRAALAPNACERAAKQPELLRATDEQRLRKLNPVARSHARFERLPDTDRLRLA